MRVIYLLSLFFNRSHDSSHGCSGEIMTGNTMVFIPE